VLWEVPPFFSWLNKVYDNVHLFRMDTRKQFRMHDSFCCCANRHCLLVVILASHSVVSRTGRLLHLRCFLIHFTSSWRWPWSIYQNHVLHNVQLIYTNVTSLHWTIWATATATSQRRSSSIRIEERVIFSTNQILISEDRMEITLDPVPAMNFQPCLSSLLIVCKYNSSLRSLVRLLRDE
jgi:hypothetical protein